MRWPVALLLVALGAPAMAQPAVAPPVAPSYTDLADLVLASPVIVRATVTRAKRLSRRLAPDVPQGQARHLVEARLVSLLKGEGLVPAGAEWLWQGPAGAAPTRGVELLAFLVPAEGGKPDIRPYRLVAVSGQLRHSDTLEARVRAILADAHTRGIPRVTGVRSGFHVPGTIAGESESQFFLAAASGGPFTLVVLRRPGAAPLVKVATSDLIDESAAPVTPETLLWRTLACDLPAALPGTLASDPGLARDWMAARAAIGACGRTSARG
ncbi:hypothetical protein [Thermaurantiacus sp.]